MVGIVERDRGLQIVAEMSSSANFRNVPAAWIVATAAVSREALHKLPIITYIHTQMLTS